MLARVWYELFAHEAEWLDLHPGEETAELRRQLRLEMADGSRAFVAWTWGPSGDKFHIGFAPASFCTDSPEVDREVSALPLWSSLVGKSITLSYVAEAQQALEIRAGNATVYCCSFAKNMWGMDVLRVGSSLPERKYVEQISPGDRGPSCVS